MTLQAVQANVEVLYGSASLRGIRVELDHLQIAGGLEHPSSHFL